MSLPQREKTSPFFSRSFSARSRVHCGRSSCVWRGRVEIREEIYSHGMPIPEQRDHGHRTLVQHDCIANYSNVPKPLRSSVPTLVTKTLLIGNDCLQNINMKINIHSFDYYV
jgi:hypothetical protein